MKRKQQGIDGIDVSLFSFLVTNTGMCVRLCVYAAIPSRYVMYPKNLNLPDYLTVYPMN